MSNAVHSAYRVFSVCFAKQMNELGFQTLPRTRFFRECNDACILVELQKEQRARDEAATYFTVNVGISINRLRKELRPESEVGPIADFLDIDDCNWKQRLGTLTGEKSDMWWSVRDELDAKLHCEELAKKFRLIAWPKIEKLTFLDSMLRSWIDGNAPGLTEYQRLTYTARLLVTLGRLQEAASAIDALEHSSIGKPWEVRAKLDLKEYRELAQSWAGPRK
jgi:Domain of unknown function (DUF4304)